MAGTLSKKLKALPTQEFLKQCFRYDRKTGFLYWKKRPPESFPVSETKSCENKAKVWNRWFAGTRAGFDVAHGRCCFLRRVKFGEHRLIWKLLKGCDPTTLDHIDGNPKNNRICNLREVSYLENQRNRKMPRNNTSGHMGIYWCSQKSKWRAFIQVEGKTVALGRFAKIEDAIEARKAAESRFGFHSNHGMSAA